MTDTNIEAMIQAKNLNAPRLTPDLIEATVAKAQYYVFPGTTFTTCLLTLTNGYHVVGESACASPENFNEEIGQVIARANAVQKIWSLEGYLLKDKLSQIPTNYLDRLNKELSELTDKLTKLVDFIKSDTFKDLPKGGQNALQEQATTMLEYRRILLTRLGK